MKLDAYELEDTRKQLRGAIVNVILGTCAVLFAFLGHPGTGGICFILLLPALLLNSAWSKKRMNKISHTNPV